MNSPGTSMNEHEQHILEATVDDEWAPMECDNLCHGSWKNLSHQSTARAHYRRNSITMHAPSKKQPERSRWRGAPGDARNLRFEFSLSDHRSVPASRSLTSFPGSCDSGPHIPNQPRVRRRSLSASWLLACAAAILQAQRSPTRRDIGACCEFAGRRCWAATGGMAGSRGRNLRTCCWNNRSAGNAGRHELSGGRRHASALRQPYAPTDQQNIWADANTVVLAPPAAIL
ncbi:hypothetical protein CC85DRAFT_80500 [Cutaneotrichosporon oleaginosum]|uniref:Uncharacterized protein n=1 Tax=Cutaneotrichosporon oleaginosum TaxID=879819 RepID=A0A0J0XND4_9TREE|nr:uncharacterized protein CC85DRAFT_80500 [Cutaneotrichosporon oleaginosum]KLT42625.1 hypothetical protein CC85DRAFT_80500 [Cutaneotrichosporon oleaginosum]TXT05258.1 hypothetical protein COLE_06578 [Cutaneotrichosporon oleaginosum]